MTELYVGNLSDDLVNLTLQMCGKKDDERPRFPRQFYDTYVRRIIDSALDIQRNVFLANESVDVSERKKYQQSAMSECVYLNHLVRTAHDGKWISDKQRDTWVTLITKVRFVVKAWRDKTG